MATTENNGLMCYKDASGNIFILYPITKAGLVDGLDTLLEGKADTTHKHSAADITSGVLPVARGGTGVSSLASLADALGAGNVASYLTFVSDRTGAELDAAFGMNNEDNMNGLGLALAMYGRYMGNDTDFTNTKKCQTIAEIFNCTIAQLHSVNLQPTRAETLTDTYSLTVTSAMISGSTKLLMNIQCNNSTSGITKSLTLNGVTMFSTGAGAHDVYGHYNDESQQSFLIDLADYNITSAGTYTIEASYSAKAYSTMGVGLKYTLSSVSAKSTTSIPALYECVKNKFVFRKMMSSEYAYALIRASLDKSLLVVDAPGGSTTTKTLSITSTDISRNMIFPLEYSTPKGKYTLVLTVNGVKVIDVTSTSSVTVAHSTVFTLSDFNITSSGSYTVTANLTSNGTGTNSYFRMWKLRSS